MFKKKKALPVLTKKTPWYTRVTRILSLLADFGKIAMSLRDKPRPLDYLGFGMQAIDWGVKVRNEYKMYRAKPGDRYFSEEESGKRWQVIPPDLADLVRRLVVDIHPVEEYFANVPGTVYPILAKLGEEDIGWVAVEGKTDVEIGPFWVANRRKKTLETLGKMLWQEVGANSCVFSAGKVVADAFDLSTYQPSKDMKYLFERLEAFARKGCPRSILIQGPPGAGKSSTARWVARQLNMNTLCVNMLSGQDISEAGLISMCRAMQPGVLILDDFDRVGQGAGSLSFLEKVTSYVPIVILTSNLKEAMLGAALRPGRVDDIFFLHRLDRAFIADFVGNDPQLLDALENLPVAYVAEFRKRQEILGHEKALTELPELIDRALSIEKKTREEEAALREFNLQRQATALAAPMPPQQQQQPTEKKNGVAKH